MKKTGMLRKRGLALVLAVATMISSWTVDWNTLKVEAAFETAGTKLSKDQSFAQYYTPTVQERITAATFALSGDAGTNVSYNVDAYINTAENNPLAGVKVAMGSGHVTMDGSKHEYTVTPTNPPVVAGGERVAIVTTFTSITGTSNSVAFYTSGGTAGAHNAAGWVNCQDTMTLATSGGGTLPSANPTNLPPSNRILIGVGDSYELSPVLSPAYSRSLTFASNNSNVSVVQSGNSATITGDIAGTSQVTISGDGVTTQNISVVIIDASLSVDNYTYSGSDIDITPNLTVKADSTLTSGTQYSLSYGNRKNVGSGSVTVTGRGAYTGFSKVINFNIEQADISTLGSAIENGTFNVNPTTNTVTGGFMLGTTQQSVGTSLIATAELDNVEINPDGSTATYHYSVSLEGTGNLKGTYDVAKDITAVGGANAISLNYSMMVTNNPLQWDGTARTPNLVVIETESGEEFDGVDEIRDNVPGTITYTYFRNGVQLPGSPSNIGTYEIRLSSNRFVGYLSDTFQIKRSLNLATVTLDQNKFIYDGADKKPNVYVEIAGTPLTEDYDYTVSYKSNTAPGDAKVIIRGIGGYNGEKEVAFEIVQDAQTDISVIMAGKTADASNSFTPGHSVNYDGSQKRPSVSVKLAGYEDPLILGTDYTLDYKNNIDAGTAHLIVELSDKYANQKIDVKYTIKPIDISKATFFVESDDSICYTGDELTLPKGGVAPGYELTFNGNTLIEYDENVPDNPYSYTVAYNNNIDAGEAEIIFSGNGNFVGSVKKTFTIHPRDISVLDDPLITINDPYVSLDIPDASYTGEQIKPNAVLYCNEKEINPATGGYSINYGTNVKQGPGTVILEGNKNFTGTRTLDFNIQPRSLLLGNIVYALGGRRVGTGDEAVNNGGVLNSDYEIEYDGFDLHGEILITDGSRILEQGTDYKVDYENNTNVPQSGDPLPTIIITGINNYKDDEVRITFNITPRDISSVNATATINPDDTVTLNVTDSTPNPTLVESIDYEIDDLGNTPGAGTKYAIISGKGNYTGTATVEYKLGTDLATGRLQLTDKTSNSDATTSREIVFAGGGENAVPRIVVFGGTYVGAPVVDEADYDVTISPSSGFTPGMGVTITVAAKEGSLQYYGELSTEYTIKKADISPKSGPSPSEYHKDGFSFELEGATTSVGTSSDIASDGTNLSGQTIYELKYSTRSYDVASGLTVTYAPNDRSTSTPIDTSVLRAGVDYVIANNTINLAETGVIRYITLNTTSTSNYTGTRKLYYRVSKPNMSNPSDIRVSAIPNKTYDGTAKIVTENDLVLTDLNEGTTLRPVTDYKIISVVSDNDGAACIKPGEITVKIKGEGLYEGERTVTYNILPLSLSGYRLERVADIPYDENSHTPSPRLLDSNGVEVPGLGTEYVLSYSNINSTYPGSYTIKAIPKTGGTIYVGESANVNYKITADITNTAYFEYKNINANRQYDMTPSGALTDRIENAAYPSVISVVRKKDNTALSQGVEYKISGTGMSLPGAGGKVTIDGNGDFYSGHVEFGGIEVYGKLSDATVGSVPDQTYDGTEKTPAVPTVTYGQKILVPGTDYVTPVTYTDNKEVGTAKINVSGKGYFTGSIDIPFNIYYDLNKATLNPSVISDMPYTGSSQKVEINPGIQVLVPDGSGGTKPLTKGVDYSIQSESSSDGADCIKVGLVTVTISPINNRSINSKTVTYRITPIEISNSNTTVTVLGGPFIYQNAEHQPLVTVVCNDNGATLNPDEYSLSYASNINAGTATIYVRGLGNYTGSVSTTFNIERKNITGWIPQISDVGYTGSAVNPSIVLTDPDNGNALNLDTDFKVITDLSQYVNAQSNIEITLEGMGNYSGQTKGTFSILKTDIGNAVLDNLTSMYTGYNIDAKQIIQVKLGNSVLPNNQYDIEFDNGAAPKDAGTYGFTIKPKPSANIGGEVGGTFNVIPKSINGVNVLPDPIPDQPWQNGSPVQPSIEINDGILGNLVLGKDYNLTYINNRDSAAVDYPQNMRPTVIITGMGNYEGEIYRYFNIGSPLNGETDEYIITTAITTNPNAPIEYVYNGQSRTPDITSVIVTKENKLTHEKIKETLRANADYSLDTAGVDTVNVGDKTVYVRGSGKGFYGTIPVEYKIVPKVALKSDMQATLELPKDSIGYYAEYTGYDIEPSVAVFDRSINKSLRPGIDFDVEYRNNHEVSGSGNENQATAWITFKGNYASEADNNFPVYFRIKPRELSGDFTIHFDAGTNRFYYTGNPITPGAFVTTTDMYGNTITLTPGTDYEIEYKNNINAGPATIIVKGKGNYGGSVSRIFEIWASLADPVATKVTIPVQPYTGSAPRPKATVVSGGNILKQGTDFEVYVRPDPADRGYYYSSGLADISSESRYYTDSVTVPFNITFDNSLFSITGPANEYVYTGKAIKPIGTVKDINGATYSNVKWTYNSRADGASCINVGTVTMTANVTVGVRSVSISKTYRIVPANIASLNIKEMPNSDYTGREIKPLVIIMHGNKQLTNNRDFKAIYSNNKYPGIAKTTVTGIGNYTGTKVLNYRIAPPALKGLKSKAAGTDKVTLSWKKSANVTGYKVSYKVGSTQKSKKVKNPTIKTTISGLTPASTYSFTVQPYITVGKSTYYGKPATVKGTTNIEVTKIKLTSTKKNRANVSWNTVAGATGYMIYRSTKKNSGYEKIATMPSNVKSYTDKGVKSKGKYYYKVRSFLKEGKKIVYGKYSSPKAITVK